MIKAELKETIDEKVAVLKEDDKVILTINLDSNPQVFNLLLLLDQADVLDFNFIDHQGEVKSKLKQVRERKGLTLEQVGDMVGVSRQSIAKIENGASEPKLSLAIKIADALNMDIREII